MKITFLTLVGMENSTTKRIFYIAKELKKKGHKINFLSLNWISKQGSSYRGDEVVDGIKIKEIKIKDNFFSLLFLGPLRLLKHLKGDLIVLSKPLPAHSIPFLLANFVKRKKFVLDADDWEGVGGGASYSKFKWFKRSLITLLEEYIPIKAKGVICASRVLEKRMSLMGVDNLAYVPNVSDIGDFDVDEKSKEKIRKEFGIKNGERVFISSGSHDMEMLVEGIEFFIKGFSKVKGNFKFLILGDGKYTQDLKDLCKELKLGDKVLFPGFLQKDKYNPSVAISHAAVIPHSAKYPYTLYAYSSSPRKMYEAMASGLVVLGSPVGEIKETLGDSGMLVEEGNVEALADKIEQIMKMNEKEIKQLGNKNLEKIKKEYNFDTQGQKVEEFLKTI
jgi:glycosyltransferase involved in cell wall biosynthesis